jgi:glycerophosphoryl diester phosphodiesterase
MPPFIEAHRGDSSHAPENTLAAFQRAIRLGADSIELDIHPAKDGTLMIIHDETVDRTTDGRGRVGDMSVEELLHLDAGAKFSPAFSGERIPRLTDVLELVANSGIQLNVEIKSSPRGLDVPRALVAHLRRFGNPGGFIVSSFDLKCLLDVRAIAPEFPLALIGHAPGILDLAEKHHLPWIHADQTEANGKIIARAHALAIRVNVWTVDDPASFPRWKAVGVDKICTNRPASMLEAKMDVKPMPDERSPRNRMADG